MKRKTRCWRYYSLDEMKAYAKETDSLSVWENGRATDATDALTGRRYQITFEDGQSRTYSFLDGEKLLWNDGVGERAETYRAVRAPGSDDTFVVQHYWSGCELPACVNLILNDKTGCVTSIDLKAGLPANPREVTRDIRFGAIEGMTVPEDARHDFTLDLVGKAICWKKPNEERALYKQVFIAPDFYNYVQEYPLTDECWMTTTPASYIRLSDELYLISVLKERQTGAHMLSIINTRAMRERELEFGLIGDDALGGDDCFRMMLNGERTGSWSTMDTLL